jgi:hypothetical protein
MLLLVGPAVLVWCAWLVLFGAKPVPRTPEEQRRYERLSASTIDYKSGMC